MSLAGTAWLYDFLLVRGGAEAVTLEIARRWPQVDVWVATRNPQLDPGPVRALSPRRPSRFPLLRAAQTRRLFRRHAAKFASYHQVVFSGMFAPVAQLARPAARAFYYAHTSPLPYAFDWQPDYRARLPRPGRSLFDRFAARERTLFARAVGAMDRVIANSRFVAERFRHHLGIIADVVYPPVALDYFHWQPPQDYFVLIASLEPHKRVDLAIRAFRRRRERLIVVGEGSQRPALERLAAQQANVELLGACPRDRIAGIVAGCRATLSLGRGEAFGLAAVESLAAGKPVIAVADGALPELIENAVSGLLVEPHVDAIGAALDAMTPGRAIAMRDDCRRRAARFSAARFFSDIERVLSRES